MNVLINILGKKLITAKNDKTGKVIEYSQREISSATNVHYAYTHKEIYFHHHYGGISLMIPVLHYPTVNILF